MALAYLMYTPRPHVCRVHPGSTGSLIKLHHLLSLLEEPEEWRYTTDVENVCSDSHDVVEDTSQLGKKDPYVLGPQWDVNIEELLYGQGETLLVTHHRDVVKTVEIGQGLELKTLEGNESSCPECSRVLPVGKFYTCLLYTSQSPRDS